MRLSKTLLYVAASTLSAAGLSIAGTASAQSRVDEVVVEGHALNGPNGLSAPVRYDDLDLTMPEGREVLWMRVRDTTSDLCRALGEDPDAYSPVLGSCRRDAMQSVRAQMRAAIDQAYAQANLAYLDPSLTP